MRQEANAPFLLCEAGVDRDAWEVALHKKLVQLNGTSNRLHKDDNLDEE